MANNDESTTQDLRKALDLLKAGNSKAARPILVRLLKTHPELEQGWYMLSFTVQDSRKQIYALEQVLNLNPENEKARERLAKISGDAELEAEAQPAVDSSNLLDERMGSFGGSDNAAEESVSSEPDLETDQVTEIPPFKPPARPIEEEPITTPTDDYSFEEKPSRRRLLILLLLIVVVVGGSAVVYFGRNLISSDVVSPEGDETSAPVATPTEEPTERGVRQLAPTWTPTVTPLPTQTQTPTSTSTPLPTLAPITGVPET
ncbi:MAG: hypothetical protein FVQ83_05075 [Chloroflexi bacterium]|nr:hypothetical protein [Chloroflexota bacterium]